MNHKEVINNIPQIINYSNLSHTLKINQIISFNMGFKYGKGPINILLYDIFELISYHVKRNSWKDTKKIIDRV